MIRAALACSRGGFLWQWWWWIQSRSRGEMVGLRRVQARESSPCVSRRARGVTCGRAARCRLVER